MNDSGPPDTDPAEQGPPESGAHDADGGDHGGDHGSDGDEAGGAQGRARARKSPQAFRTISEVADELQIPQHVLRFWETKFPQVRPLKRGGGRRYYRPDDIALLRRISGLLYVQGYTIKGVQRLLREGGGRLSDDIPPPPAEELAGPDEAARTDAQLPMPGLLPPAPSPAPPAHGMPLRPRPRPDAPRADFQRPEAPRAEAERAEAQRVEAQRVEAQRAGAENARLRATLEDVLHALESLRALLP